jgi:hypothetical protein
MEITAHMKMEIAAHMKIEIAAHMKMEEISRKIFSLFAITFTSVIFSLLFFEHVKFSFIMTHV